MEHEIKSLQPMARSWAGAALAAAGALFCVTAGLGGAQALCLTEGCSLYKDVVLAGVSLWWYGAACFGLIAGLAAAGKKEWAFVLILAGLVGDCGLLLWMALSAPCLNCLIAGAFFFLTSVALLPAALHAPRRRKVALCAAGLWLFLLSPNLFEVGRELLAPWPMYGAATAPIKLFFSPSCPACRDAVLDLLPRAKDAAFYPVAEDARDVARIARMVAALGQGKEFGAAFQEALAATPDADAPWAVHFQLWRNRMALARMSARTIPVTLVLGYPKSKPAAAPGMSRREPADEPAFGTPAAPMLQAPPPPLGRQDSPLIPKGDFRGCSQDKPGDCD